MDVKELKKNNLDVSDLVESMRNLGYFALDSVEYAIYEANGTLSAMEKDINIEPSIPIIIIKNGKPVLKNLQLIKVTKQEINEFFKIFIIGRFF